MLFILILMLPIHSSC